MSRELELLIELLGAQVAQAPGSEASTLRALSVIGTLTERPSIADFGCGRGASALVLSRATGCEVLAVDRLGAMVEATAQRAIAAGLPVRAVIGDISKPPVEPGSLDLLWCEGAAYAIGLENALVGWGPLLAEEGALALTELCWRTDSAPDEARAWWAEAYPGMLDASGCLQLFRESGYTLIESFFLPDTDWDAYYEPVAAHLPAFRARHPGDAIAAAVANEMEDEITAWERWGEHYGYLFLVGRRQRAQPHRPTTR